MYKPKAEVSATQVDVSRFGFTKPEQWQPLLDKLKSPNMRVASADHAVIYLKPSTITTEQAVEILTESGFEVARVG